MELAEEFRRWVLDPARTSEELCTAEIILESGENMWRAQHQQYRNDWDEQQKKRKERAGNPAYRPTIQRESVDRTVEVAHLLKHFSASWMDDRPVRDLSALHFFPSLEDVSITAETMDFSALHKLPHLRRLSIHEPGTNGGHVITEVNGLAGLKLNFLSLSIRTPWPDLSALAKLPMMESLNLRLNLLALENVEALASVKTVILEPDFHCNTPLRSIQTLPRMPRVTQLRVNSVGNLDGIEQLQALKGVDLVGPYTDLAPLAALKNVTYARLEGNWFMDLTPLTRMPELREILLVRERPLDVGPLADAPALRQVGVERCAIIRTEVSALNAGFLPWSLDFALEEPRPLEPVKLFCYRPQDPEVKESMSVKEPNPREELYSDDPHYAASEARWFARELQQRLTRLLGEGWGDITSFTDRHPGHQHLTIQRFRDIVRMEEVIQTCRELMAICRLPWQILIDAEPHGDLSADMEEIRAQRDEQERDWLDQEYDAQQEKEDYEDFRRMRRELYERLEREHRMRLLQQQGEEINPAEFSPSAKPTASKAAAEDDFEDEDEDDEGGLADFDDGEPDAFGEEMSFVFYVTEKYVWVAEHMRETFESTLGVRTEDWHALPQPVLERPRPHYG